ncbi:glutamate--cysteine ligase [Propionibacteriaceae bacterium Y2011]
MRDLSYRRLADDTVVAGTQPVRSVGRSSFRGRIGAQRARMRHTGGMGAEVERREFTREDRTRYREKVRRCLDALARMLTQSPFDTGQPMVGLEMELNLIGADRNAAMTNAAVLAAIDDPLFVTELGQFNIELNVPPRRLAEAGLASWEAEIRDKLNSADEAAARVDSELALIGILPTLRPADVTADHRTENPRYGLLDEQVFAARGEDLVIRMQGVEQLDLTTDTIMPEAACTSTQVHLQASPDDFAAHWNASQAIAGIEVALAANSPYLFGKQLYAETRIPLFMQATDTRSEELKAQGVRPRVWFGERWVTSVFDLFEENARYFPALLPIVDEADPIADLDAGRVPELHELNLHNGTVYRWNRPVYDTSDGAPHLRVENRVLPGGPTVADTVANVAFYAGLVRALATVERPIWTRMSYGTAQDNFEAGVRQGIDASVYWPGVGTGPVTDLVLRKLLPLAHAGLSDWGASTADADHYLQIIEQRCLRRRNGATWQTSHVGARESQGATRSEALTAMVGEYVERMHSNEPVHTWKER